MGWDIAHVSALDRHAADVGSILRSGRDFFPRVNSQSGVSYSVSVSLCASTCIEICAHVKDPVVHIRVQWIMETLKR